MVGQGHSMDATAWIGAAAWRGIGSMALHSKVRFRIREMESATMPFVLDLGQSIERGSYA